MSQSNRRPVKAAWPRKPRARLEAMAKDRQELSWAWQRANESMTYKEHRLKFAYSQAPVHRVPAFIREQAGGMINHSCWALSLSDVAILWLEWCLKPCRSICFVLDHPVHGMALAPTRSGEGFGISGTRVNRRVLLAGLSGLASAGDVVLIRWDIPRLEMLFAVAHEVKHLWFSYNDQGQSLAEEEAACNTFAREATQARGIK